MIMIIMLPMIIINICCFRGAWLSLIFVVLESMIIIIICCFRGAWLSLYLLF
jgi:hypothetical protein